eukprot:m51a1_g4402 hypothetical protein (840) ;mRNA; r:417036-420747
MWSPPRYSELLQANAVAGVVYGVEPKQEESAAAPSQKAAPRGAAAPKKGGDLAGKLHSLNEGATKKEDVQHLRPYQLEALNWLIGHFENGINAVLADEMGLGKTITTIALLGHLWHMNVRGPFLVVAPVSTLSNWTNEFAVWAPTLPVLLYHGTPDEREKLRMQLLQMTKRPPPRSAMKLTSKRRKTATGAADTGEMSEALAEAMRNKQLPIVVTSYEIAIRDIRFLRQHRWKYMVVDEAHRLKNFECKLICELRTLKTESRLLLTGTPLQNNLAELWSLLNFLLPDIFSNLADFKQWFDFTGLLESSSQASDGEQQLHSDLVTKLHSLMRPFLLRRLKQDVEIGLPKKQEVVVYSGTTQTQRSLYDAIKDRSLKLRNVSLNNLVMQLRKVCNHPYLFEDEVIKRVFEDDSSVAPDEEEKEHAPEAEVEEAGGSISTRLRARTKETHYEELPDEEEDALDDDEFEKEIMKCVVHDSADDAPAAPKEEGPRRRRSAYNLFFGDEWAKVRLSGRKLGLGEVSKISGEIAARWNTLPADERRVYEERLAEEERAQTDLLGQNSTLARDCTSEELSAVCGKMALLNKMLPELHRRGHRVLLFSQMTRVLDLLEEYIVKAGYTYCRIDGSLAQADRKQQIEEYTHENIFLFLLSTRAGGQGINLAAADTVIIYDSDWNPQMDLQAMDRCHRIGQTRPVVVYRLITANTVDSRILSRARDKLMLERLVVGKGGFSRKAPATSMTDEELRDMLRWRAGEGGERAVTDDELARLLDRELIFKDAEAAADRAKAAALGQQQQAQAQGQQQGQQALSPSPSQSVTPAPAPETPAGPPGFMFVTTARGQL